MDMSLSKLGDSEGQGSLACCDSWGRKELAPSIRVFSNESTLCMRWPKYWSFSFMIHTVKGFSIVNEAEIDVFLELSCFFHDPTDVGSLISGSSAFSKSSLNILKFTVHHRLEYTEIHRVG